MKYSIDSMNINENELIVIGWVFPTEGHPVEHSLTYKNGSAVEHKYSIKKRADVEAYFESDKVEGFALSAPFEDGDHMVLTFKSGRDVRKIQLSLETIYPKNRRGVFSHINANTIKTAISFYKENGSKALVKKVSNKLKHISEDYDYRDWYKETAHTLEHLALQRLEAHTLPYQGLISIIIPAYNTKKELLVLLLESFKAQTYGNFEVVFADASSAGNVQVEETIAEYSKHDHRFVRVPVEKNLGISGNTNVALHAAKGDFIALCDHDDELPPWALFEVAKAISENPRAEFLYTDEDKCNFDTTTFFEPNFKSDYNPDMLCTNNYITHFSVIKKSLFDRVGDFDPACDGAQDFDIILRCVDEAVKDELPRLRKYRELITETKDAAEGGELPKLHKYGKVLNETKDAAEEGELLKLHKHGNVLKEMTDAAVLAEKTGLLEDSIQKLQEGRFISEKVIHVPLSCYHWRTHIDSTAMNPESKLYAYEAGRVAVKKHYDRVGIEYKDVINTPNYGFYQTLFQNNDDDLPLISIIIPNKDHVSDLNKCITSVADRSTYRNIEFIIVENNSEEKNTFAYYDKLTEVNGIPVKVVYYEGAFNYSAINNFGVKSASGEILLLMNNDIELTKPDSIYEMYQYAKRENVGAVGPMLLFPDNTIQSAGIVVGIMGTAGSTFQRIHYKENSYMHRMTVVQDYSALTAACLMIKKTDYEAINGFDETFPVAFNDVDLCLKLRQLGLLNVYTPYARFYHYESKTRGLENTPEKKERFKNDCIRFREKWNGIIENLDPYYNQNLTLRSQNFALRNLKYEKVGEAFNEKV